MKYYKTELIDINSIKINKNNCKLHSSYQLELIKNSIKEFGFTCPLLVDENNNLMAGHGRLEAIKQLNKTDLKSSPITKLPCVCVNGLSDMQKRALIIADNKITECGSYDEDILSFELKELQSIGFDLESIGFNDDELNHLLNQFNVESVNSVNNNFQTFDNKEYLSLIHISEPTRPY
mgnify:FL=1